VYLVNSITETTYYLLFTVAPILAHLTWTCLCDVFIIFDVTSLYCGVTCTLPDDQ